jgi:hypothetical protein
MMRLEFVLVLFCVLFATIGTQRGWAKELLVTFSSIVALFVLEIFSRYIPFIRDLLNQPSEGAFFLKTAIMLGLVFAGYQTPNISRIPAAKLRREKLSDALLGLVIGFLNGFIVIGSIWYFMRVADYPFREVITPPGEDVWIVRYLVPAWLSAPFIYVAVALAFIFVLVLFI